jgi:pyruvate phosphate dikinase, PEP/pyruvate binding domain protein
MLDKQLLNQLYLKDTSFVNLMTRRIFNVLLIANPYDAFMLEDDGRIDEKLFNEYAALSLRYPPRFTQVSTETEAWGELHRNSFDLIIVMPGTDNSDTFDIARGIKHRFQHIPLVVLTPFSHGITARIEHEDLSDFEYVFCWLGNTDLLLSIIKLIEDKMNLDHDIEEGGVQQIILVEDNIRFYSSVLPELYKFVLQQSMEFATEALNEHQRTLRMRGRPKIVLARTYEEATTLYDRHPNNVLGVITDARYPRGGVVDPQAGVQLLAELRKRDPFLPLILESAESENALHAKAYNADFIDKNSKKMAVDLREVVKQRFGFGDFIFRDPQTHQEVMRAHNLKEMQSAILNVPAESLLYHITRNHVSRWLRSRAMFPAAEFVKQLSWEELQDIDAHRRAIFEAIVDYRRMKNQGVVAVFRRDRFDRYSNFARIGEGSLGGKGRGLAFIDNIVKHHPELNQFDNATVMIPKTVVLCTDLFEEFMDHNNLYQLALSDADDAVILDAFRRATLPASLEGDILTFIEATSSPIAVRSSSLLEDSHYQPFAGIYNTYMVPLLDNRHRMLSMLCDAIKGVYASVFFKDSKAYMQATRNVIDQEKMAVILQEVVGRQYGDRYYPSISGVGRSLNYYPIGDERAEEGIVNLALGLGKYIVDGGQTLRICPHHPGKVLQMSDTEMALRETQTRFYALDLKNMGENFSVDDAFNLLKLSVREADKDGALQYLASTYNPTDQVIYPGVYPDGRKIISFVGVLEHDVVPLPHLLREVLRLGQEAMRRPVEIEFAVEIDATTRSCVFYLLQIRPMVDVKSDVHINLSEIRPETILLQSNNALGHGQMDDITDVVYVKTDGYNAGNNPLIAEEISRINAKFLDRGEHYVLVGPGRWGSSDSWLGIPVKWPNISAARIIVEAGLTNYRVDPSQGTHFFQNLTSFGVGYFTINDFNGDGVYNRAVLDALPAVEETAHVRHVRFPHALSIKVDGKKKLGYVLTEE